MYGRGGSMPTAPRLQPAAARTLTRTERTAADTPRTVAAKQHAVTRSSPSDGFRAAAPLTSDGVAFNKLEAMAKGEVGVAGVKNPPALHKVTWTPLGDYLKTKG